MNTTIIISSNPLFSLLIKEALISQNSDIKVSIIDSYAKYRAIEDIHKISLIVCDYTLEKISSLEIVEELRYRTRYVNPIFYIEESGQNTNIVRAYSVGTSSCYCVPYDPNQLAKDIIALLIERKEL